MDDVASSAEVSRQTVSRVLHDHAYVTEETRRRVRQAIERLGYYPDVVARNLARKRTFLLAAVLTELAGYNRARILMHAEEEARARGYNVFICGSPSSPRGEPIDSPLLNSQKYEGVLILYRGAVDDRLAFLNRIRGDAPVVTLGYAPDVPRVDRVVLDDRGGGYRAVAHLLASGRRAIAQIAGPPKGFDTVERMRGCAEALAEAGLQPDDRLVRHGDWTPASGHDQACRLLESGISFDAVFVHSDLMALGCLRALHEAGRRVPADVAVVGFDNIAIGALLTPTLSTVDQPVAEIGRTAVRHLIARIEREDTSAKESIVPTELVVRESSAAG